MVTSGSRSAFHGIAPGRTGLMPRVGAKDPIVEVEKK